MIRLENLHKSFKTRAGTVHAVKGVGFEARDGEITGLLGPNGAGKTTTLRMLYTLMKPDQGRIEVDGIDAATDPATVRRRLGVLPDARGVYKRLTARENIRYFGRLHGLDDATIDAREPTNGLDVMTTRGLRAFLRELKAGGRCVIFSSHIMQEVAALCDRIVVIAHGEVRAIGTPEELREQTGLADLEDVFVHLAGLDSGEAA